MVLVVLINHIRRQEVICFLVLDLEWWLQVPGGLHFQPCGKVGEVVPAGHGLLGRRLRAKALMRELPGAPLGLQCLLVGPLEVNLRSWRIQVLLAAVAAELSPHLIRVGHR